MRIIRTLSLFVVMSSSPVIAEQNCDAECQTRLINAYYLDISKIQMTGSTERDIDSFLDSLHDEVRYIHVEYQADFDRETWKKAFNRQLNAGSYNNSKEAVNTVSKIIHGYNFAAVEFTSRHNNKDGNLVTSPPRLATFGFKDGKISDVRDYWYHLAER